MMRHTVGPGDAPEACGLPGASRDSIMHPAKLAGPLPCAALGEGEPLMPRMTGAKFMVEMMQAYGVTHAFYMPMVVTKALVEMEKAGIRRIMTHGEKAAAYMADGYARAAHRAGVCMAQNVGAANLAAGLQDAYLAGSPVIAMTGRGIPMQQYRYHKHENDHLQPFATVTKYNVIVDSVGQLPL